MLQYGVQTSTIVGTDVRRGAGFVADAPVTKGEQAEAASAHARINIPLNLENWKHLPEATQKELLWFHQHLLDEGMKLEQAGEALDYDHTTVYRVLKGSYEGNWGNILKAIASYRKLLDSRGTIQKSEFAANRCTELIFGGLDYALANNSITLIVGESGQGKTMSARAWKRENNHGRAVLVTAPPYGGPKALLARIAEAVGVNKQLNFMQMQMCIYRAFNPHRVLIVDEAHRLLPGDRRAANPVMLEILRDIKDETDCALALIATQRFSTELQKGEYMFEQVLGRIGMPVRLPRKMVEGDIEPILRQYFGRPGKAVMESALKIANELGRVRLLVEVLKVASRIAKRDGSRITEEHYFKSLKVREQMMGEAIYAK